MSYCYGTDIVQLDHCTVQRYSTVGHALFEPVKVSGGVKIYA